jgi:hypothetical protein
MISRGYLTINLVDKWAVIEPGAKTRVKVSQNFLSALRTALKGPELMAKLYMYEIKKIKPLFPGLSQDSQEVVVLRKAPAAIIASHLKATLGRLSKDEESFISQLVIPLLRDRDEGEITEEKIARSNRSPLLRSQAATVLDNLNRCLNNSRS